MTGWGVSVVVPTYNRADLVCRALASVEAQTVPAAQIVVVDDGSTDGTGERLARQFPRVEVVRQPNRGVSAARNAGIAAARQRWIAFLDSDDEWLPEKLERQLRALAASGLRVCHCDEIWLRAGRRVNPRRRHAKRGGRIYVDCLPLCAISPSAVLVERDVLARVGPFDERLPVCEDYDMWLRVTARFAVELVAAPLVIKHGGRADQLSRSRWGLDRFRIRALARAWRELDLAPAARRATLATLTAKLEIVLGGARKRGSAALADELTAQLEHFRLLARLEGLAA